MPLNMEIIGKIKELSPEERRELLSRLPENKQDEIITFLKNPEQQEKIRGAEQVLDVVSAGLEKHRQKMKATVYGAADFVPLSDQIASASSVARRTLFGDLKFEDMADNYSKTVKATANERMRLAQEEPAATGVGRGAMLAAETALTGGLGPVLQAGLGSAQTMGAVGGHALARGEAPIESAKQGAWAANLGLGAAGIPSAYRGTKDLIGKLRSKWSGLAPNEIADRAVPRILRGSDTQARKMAASRPDIHKTFMDENLLESGFGPKGTTPVTKIKKNIDLKTRLRGRQIGDIVEETSTPVNPRNISDSLEMKALELEATDKTLNKALVKRLRNTAKEIAKEGEISPQRAWERRQKWDEVAFENDALFEPSKSTKMASTEARIIRDAYQDELVESVNRDLGDEGVSRLTELSKTYGDLKAMQKVAESGEFRTMSSPLDRLTIGAVSVAAKKPAVAAGFFGGRELAKFAGPRTKLIQGGEQSSKYLFPMTALPASFK